MGKLKREILEERKAVSDIIEDLRTRLSDEENNRADKVFNIAHRLALKNEKNISADSLRLISLMMDATESLNMTLDTIAACSRHTKSELDTIKEISEAGMDSAHAISAAMVLKHHYGHPSKALFSAIRYHDIPSPIRMKDDLVRIIYIADKIVAAEYDLSKRDKIIETSYTGNIERGYLVALESDIALRMEREEQLPPNLIKAWNSQVRFLNLKK